MTTTREDTTQKARCRYSSRSPSQNSSESCRWGRSPSRDRPYRNPSRSPTHRHSNRTSPTPYTQEVSHISISTPKPSEASSSDSDDNMSDPRIANRCERKPCPVKAKSCKRRCPIPHPHMHNTYNKSQEPNSDMEPDIDTQSQADTDSIISSLMHLEDEHSFNTESTASTPPRTFHIPLPRPSKVSNDNITDSPVPTTENHQVPIKREVPSCTLSQPIWRTPLLPMPLTPVRQHIRKPFIPRQYTINNVHHYYQVHHIITRDQSSQDYHYTPKDTTHHKYPHHHIYQ